jgi:DNA-directed RNA polymerase specialized sigma24 family protein
VKGQDARAHWLLFDCHYGRIFSFLQRRSRRRAAEETAADVFFETWRNAGAFWGASQAST